MADDTPSIDVSHLSGNGQRAGDDFTSMLPRLRLGKRARPLGSSVRCGLCLRYAEPFQCGLYRRRRPFGIASYQPDVLLPTMKDLPDAIV
jgi:hypothetical protein